MSSTAREAVISILNSKLEDSIGFSDSSSSYELTSIYMQAQIET